MISSSELRPAGELTAEDLGSVHLIGIGGVGMGGLARLLLTRGVPDLETGPAPETGRSPGVARRSSPTRPFADEREAP